MEKYSDVLISWLSELGYTHCFFVAGGNSMHLLNAARTSMRCIPVVHEVAAGIAVEYFNEVAEARDTGSRAFALVTAGPGLTNILTAMAGAFLESRELLVLGGQVKTEDLSSPELRQRGIQEVDGTALAKPVTVESKRLMTPLRRSEIVARVLRGRGPRPGPVFLEIPIDVQAAPVAASAMADPPASAPASVTVDESMLAAIEALIEAASRPVMLVGGGVSRRAADVFLGALSRRGLPIMTTYNGADRIASDDPMFFGRPNTWGMRHANVLLQQADLIVALGTRLGLQQTGFNWREFAPLATIVQVDVDQAELNKGHPRIDLPILGNADDVVSALSRGPRLALAPWHAFCARVRELLPLADPANSHAEGYLDPYEFYLDLSEVCSERDLVIPCSSGGAFTVFYQVFMQRSGQVIASDKSLASMGYGLSGAIGAAFASPSERVIHIEGDGGFAQSMQEMGTVSVQRLHIKTFLLVNRGYASIRMTQRNYFDGAYLGCDSDTGLGFPDWPLLAQAFDIPSVTLSEGWHMDAEVKALLADDGPALFIVPIDPEQTYFPKITSRVTATGSMESNPLHRYTPDLPDDVAREVFRYLPAVEGASASHPSAGATT